MKQEAHCSGKSVSKNLEGCTSVPAHDFIHGKTIYIWKGLVQIGIQTVPHRCGSAEVQLFPAALNTLESQWSCVLHTALPRAVRGNAFAADALSDDLLS